MQRCDSRITPQLIDDRPKLFACQRVDVLILGIEDPDLWFALRLIPGVERNLCAGSEMRAETALRHDSGGGGNIGQQCLPDPMMLGQHVFCGYEGFAAWKRTPQVEADQSAGKQQACSQQRTRKRQPR